MKGLSVYVILVLMALVAGCATNGSHMYVDGKCISCWNNPLTMETLDYESVGANNYTVLSWHEMMLEGLSRMPAQDLSLYGEDYLKSRIGNKIVSLRNNEISYQKQVARAVTDLNSALQSHTLKPAYQATVSSMLGNYDFGKQEFPVTFVDSFELSGGNNIERLPRKITVNLSNHAALPNLAMTPDQAETFLAARRNARGLYIRYVIEITGMTAPSVFDAKVREIQFIDVKPSIVTREEKEKHAPFQAVKI